MTIDQTVFWIAIALLGGFVLAVLAAVLQFKSARRLPYFLLRKERLSSSWRLMLAGLGMGVSGLVILLFGREVAYVIVQPTPSITPSPTVTQTPTVTLTSTITDTPEATSTPTATPTSTQTPTPQLPAEIRVLIRESQTPFPDAVFSPLQLSRRLDGQNQAVNPQENFFSPLGRLYAAFTYNNLQDGVRWSAIWKLGDRVVCIETQPWDGGTGGYGYTECELENWPPGEYEIQIFYGEEWMVSARFDVNSNEVTPTSTPGS
jgi:hypothetical protein